MAPSVCKRNKDVTLSFYSKNARSKKKPRRRRKFLLKQLLSLVKHGTHVISSVELIRSSRDGWILWVNDRPHYYQRTNDMTKYWDCCWKKVCNGRVHTDLTSVNNVIISQPHVSKCLPKPALKECKKAIALCKEKIRASFSEPTTNIVEEADYHLSKEAAILFPYKDSAKRMVQRYRNKIQGFNLRPLKLADVRCPRILVEHPRSCESMLLYDSGFKDKQRMLIFGTNESLNRLISNTQWYSDGTFKTVTRFFKQLYSIHVRIGTKLYPVVIALMANGGRASYERLFERLAILRPQLRQLELTLNTDYEIAVKLAMSKVFPLAIHRYCFFHLTQNVWRQTQKHILSRQYKRDRKLRIAIKMLPAVAFVPTPLVTEAFNEIVNGRSFRKQLEKNPALSHIVEYFRNTYIGIDGSDGRRPKQPTFAISEWNCFDRTSNNLPRTTNAVEGFHNSFNKSVQVTHASFWILVKRIKRTIISSSNERLRHKMRNKRPKAIHRKRYKWLNQKVTAIVRHYFRSNSNIEYVKKLAMCYHIHNKNKTVPFDS